MAAGNRERKTWIATALLAGVALCALAPMASLPARAQSPNVDQLAPNIPPDAKLILAANELVYNRDADTVTARGAVQINYGGYQLVAKQVVYDQTTGQLRALGDIEFIEPTGNRVYAQELTLSDDFANGFANSLRTYLAKTTSTDPGPIKRAATAADGFVRACRVGSTTLSAWAGEPGLIRSWDASRVDRHLYDNTLRSLREWLALVAHLEPLRRARLDAARQAILRPSSTQTTLSAHSNAAWRRTLYMSACGPPDSIRSMSPRTSAGYLALSRHLGQSGITSQPLYRSRSCAPVALILPLQVVR